MMQIARQGDLDSGGGTLNSGVSSTVYVDGIPVALVDTGQTPHGKGIHSSSVVISGSSTVIVESKQVAHVGSSTRCGHPVATGSSTTYVG
jgi:uncharacterized Zn-binding protein involved in type VI secretion